MSKKRGDESKYCKGHGSFLDESMFGSEILLVHVDTVRFSSNIFTNSLHIVSHDTDLFSNSFHIVCHNFQLLARCDRNLTPVSVTQVGDLIMQSTSRIQEVYKYWYLLWYKQKVDRGNEIRRDWRIKHNDDCIELIAVHDSNNFNSI